MTTRERFRAVMNFGPFDRLPVLEWAGWWDKTIDRWHAEGLPGNLTDRYDICRHFGLDIYKQDWFSVRTKGCPSPASHGAPIITSEADYERIRPFLFPDSVNTTGWTRWAEEQASGDIVLWFTLEGFFWFPRTLFGIEQHLYAFYDQPKLMHRINSDLTDWMLKIIDRVCSVAAPDFMTFAEDMSYNHGPMLSRDLFDEFMKPYYLRITPELKKRGILAIVDSDGDITVPGQWFQDAGVEGILPLERQAGVDIAALRRQYPRMRFIGHYDKMVMNRGESAMRAEFERLAPTAAQGGFLIGCDHQTPPGVSLRDYELFVCLFREYAERIGCRSAQRNVNPGRSS